MFNGCDRLAAYSGTFREDSGIHTQRADAVRSCARNAPSGILPTAGVATYIHGIRAKQLRCCGDYSADTNEGCQENHQRQYAEQRSEHKLHTRNMMQLCQVRSSEGRQPFRQLPGQNQPLPHYRNHRERPVQRPAALKTEAGRSPPAHRPATPSIHAKSASHSWETHGDSSQR